MLAAPREFAELIFGRTAEQNRVAFFEVLGQFRELDDFGRAYEGKVFGIKVDNF